MEFELRFVRYQGTFLKTSNLTARANTRATITAQASSESEVPLLEGVVLDVSVDIGVSPWDRTIGCGPIK